MIQQRDNCIVLVTAKLPTHTIDVLTKHDCIVRVVGDAHLIGFPHHTTMTPIDKTILHRRYGLTLPDGTSLLCVQVLCTNLMYVLHEGVKK